MDDAVEEERRGGEKEEVAPGVTAAVAPVGKGPACC